MSKVFDPWMSDRSQNGASSGFTLALPPWAARSGIFVKPCCLEAGAASCRCARHGSWRRETEAGEPASVAETLRLRCGRRRVAGGVDALRGRVGVARGALTVRVIAVAELGRVLQVGLGHLHHGAG